MNHILEYWPIYSVAGVSLISLLLGIWKISAAATELQLTVRQIARNDLPHIYQELQELSRRLNDLPCVRR